MMTHGMIRNSIKIAALGSTMVLAAGGFGGGKTENGLGGFRLFETGVRLLDVFGNPDDIQAVGVGGAAVGPSGGPAGGAPTGGGAPAGGGGPRGGNNPKGGGGGGGADTDLGFTNDFSWGDTSINQDGVPPGKRRGGGTSGGFGPPPGASGLPPGAGGVPPTGGGAGGGNTGGSSTNARQSYTRWIYNRPQVKYGFIIDRFDKIVQIEAIGLTNPKVRTKTGITFGSTFKDVIKRYGQPEVMELGANQMILRYLVLNKVAFRLNRLGVNKPYQVTAMMVAAGKY